MGFGPVDPVLFKEVQKTNELLAMLIAIVAQPIVSDPENVYKDIRKIMKK